MAVTTPTPEDIQRMQDGRDYDVWLDAMAAHFDRMVAASMNNKHADTKRELMRGFMTALASRCDREEPLRW